MKKRKIDLFDREPWYKNHASPMAKWMENFSVIGFYYLGKNGGLLWFIFFNPAAQILYIVFGVIFTLICFGSK